MTQSNIVLKRRRTSQPQGFFPVSSDAIAEGLDAAFQPYNARWAGSGSDSARYFDSANLARSLQNGNGDATFPTPTAEGMMHAFDNSSQKYWYWVNGTIPTNYHNGFTAIVIAKPTESTPASARNIFAWGNSASDTYCCIVAQVATTGHLQLFIRDNASTSVSIATTQQLVAPNTYRFGLWSDGVSNHGVRIGGASYTSSTTLGTTTAPNRFAIGRTGRTAYSQQSTLGVGLVLIYSKVLSPGRIQNLIDNPWQVWEEPSWRNYAQDSSSGIPKTTKLTLLGVG